MKYLSYIINHFNKIKRHFMRLDHPYFYVFVRQDLSIAQQLVQSNHASFAVSQMFADFKEIPSLVLIGVADKSELEDVINRLTKHDIKYAAFYEPDNDEGLTAIATEPIYEKKKRSKLIQYKLWKPNIPESHIDFQEELNKFDEESGL